MNGTGGGGGGGGAVGKTSMPSALPFLSQIAEEDLTSASTSVTSFHLPNSIARRTQANALPPGRTLSDHELFVRVNDETNKNRPAGQDLSSTTANKPTAYAHFNFDQSSKQLTKGNSTISISSDSVDVPLGNIDLGIPTANGLGATRRKVQTTSPPEEPTADSPPKTNTVNGKTNLRKQTQDIAARAAQRRATRHHKELMEDMGKESVTDRWTMHHVSLSIPRLCIFVWTCSIEGKYCECLWSWNHSCETEENRYDQWSIWGKCDRIFLAREQRLLRHFWFICIRFHCFSLSSLDMVATTYVELILNHRKCSNMSQQVTNSARLLHSVVHRLHLSV